MDPHKVLGVLPGATADEIKAAYKRAAFRAHPDRNKDSDATERFQEIVAAYALLTEQMERAFAETFTVDFVDWSAFVAPPPRPSSRRRWPARDKPATYGAGPTPEMIAKSTSRLFESLMRDIKKGR